MKDLFDDDIKKNVTNYRLNKNLSNWYLANKWLLLFFLLFPLLMDILFETFSLTSLFKTLVIVALGAFWIYLKYIFVKHILVDKDRKFKPWQYNLYNDLIWGLIIAILAIPSSETMPIGGFSVSFLIIFFVGGIFSLLFTNLEVPRIQKYLDEQKNNQDSEKV